MPCGLHENGMAMSYSLAKVQLQPEKVHRNLTAPPTHFEEQAVHYILSYE